MSSPMGPFEIILSLAAILFVLYTVGVVCVGLLIELGSKKKQADAPSSESHFIKAGRKAWTEVGRDGLTDGARLSLMVIAMIVILLLKALF